MLQWIHERVPTPFGEVNIVHWAVSDAHDLGDDSENTTYRFDESEDQLGSVMWNSNIVALEYLNCLLFHRNILESGRPVENLSTHENLSTKGRQIKSRYHILELGAGVGILGIALAMGGASVVLTDIKELVPLQQHNILINEDAISSNDGRCTAIPWRWGRDSSNNKVIDSPKLCAPNYPRTLPHIEAHEFLNHSIDYVLLCDALYGNPSHWVALEETLREILEYNQECKIINFCEQRIEGVEKGFLKLLEEKNHLIMSDTIDRDTPTMIWSWEVFPLTQKSQLGMCTQVTHLCLKPLINPNK